LQLENRCLSVQLPWDDFKADQWPKKKADKFLKAYKDRERKNAKAATIWLGEESDAVTFASDSIKAYPKIKQQRKPFKHEHSHLPLVLSVFCKE